MKTYFSPDNDQMVSWMVQGTSVKLSDEGFSGVHALVTIDQWGYHFQSQSGEDDITIRFVHGGFYGTVEVEED